MVPWSRKQCGPSCFSESLVVKSGPWVVADDPVLRQQTSIHTLCYRDTDAGEECRTQNGDPQREGGRPTLSERHTVVLLSLKEQALPS